MTNAFNKDRLYAENESLRERIAELESHNLGLTKTLVELEAELKKLRNGMPVYFDENTLEQAAHD